MVGVPEGGMAVQAASLELRGRQRVRRAVRVPADTGGRGPDWVAAVGAYYVLIFVV